MEKKILTMPAPPAFLLQKNGENAIAALSSSTQSENKSVAKPKDAPRSVDYALYHASIEERNSAEIRTAEIYSKYLEMVAFSEKLLAKINRFAAFKTRVRKIYNQALLGDQITLDNLKLTRRDLDNQQKLLSEMNIENESLRASVQAHQEAFAQMAKNLGQAEAAMEYANTQFQLLSSEYEKRGEQIQELEKKLNGSTAQISELGERTISLQKRADYLHDENLIIQNQLRQAQIQESGLATLNDELTQTIPKLQKQIHILEEKIRMERQVFQARESSMNEELDRLRENKLVDALVEKSKKMTAPEKAAPAAISLNEKVTNKQNWNEFYQRWSLIIDELSSHSAPIKPTQQESMQNDQLNSEAGDLDFI